MLTIFPAIAIAAIGAVGSLNNDTIPQDSIPVDTLFSKELDDFVITAKKKVIKSDGATLTYDLKEDVTSKGSTLLDALRKVPMVTVDGQDKIKINGDSNFKIYVNGKEEPMLEANYDKIFKSMPAESFSKIEVITEPGAKYDAEGTGGILNLITETKQSKDGYTGSITGNLSNRESALSLFGRAKYGNLNIDANINTAATLLSKQKQKSFKESIDYTNNEAYRLINEQTQNIGFKYFESALNASWTPDEKNIISFGGNYTGLDGSIDNMRQSSNMYDINGNRKWASLQIFNGSLKMGSASANASFQHNFSESGRLIIAYLFNYGKNPLHITAENIEEYNNSVPYSYSFNNINNYTREHTAQIDYSQYFKEKKHLLEAGTKMIFRDNSTNSTQGYGNSLNNWISDESEDVLLTQLQNIYALYASYTGTFGSWSVKTGLRYEHTDMGMKYLNRDNLKSWSDLNDIVPNAAITYMFSPYANLRLAYQMRISRPSLDQINPYQMNIMDNYVQEGNPNLSSQKNNNVSLTYSNFGGKIGGNIGITYSQTDNAIENYDYFDGQINYSTYANIGSRKNIALQGFMNYNISNKMSVSLNGRIAYVHLRSTSPDYSNHGWTGNYGANWSYTAPSDIKISAYGGQNVHNVSLQGYSSGFYYYGLGVSKDFLKNKSLNVALNASNIFQKYSSYKNYTYTKNHYVFNNWMNQSWRVSLSISWKFGHLSTPAKKVELDITNDDLSSGKKGQGGIGL